MHNQIITFAMTALTTPPLPPKTIQALQLLDINSVEVLRQHGAIHTFLQLKAAGFTVTRHLLWQLLALTENRQPHDFSAAEKEFWLVQLKNHPPVACFPDQAEMQYWMEKALSQARLAAASGEVPVGAVVVHNKTLIGSGFNQCISHHNISHHAEIQALAAAGQHQHNYRLDHCDVYVTLEPCAMCASALIQSRIKRLIYAAPEPKTGAAGSVINLFAQRTLNAHTAVLGGIMAEDSQTLLRQFFRNKRIQSAEPALIHSHHKIK